MDTRGNSMDQYRCGNARRALSCIVTLAMLLSANVVHATHFRYGHINWSHVGPASDKTIQFTLQAAWRQDGVSNPGSGGPSEVYRCVNPADFTNQSTKLPTIPCTGPIIGGKPNPGVGDVFVENIGTTFFDFGDGTPPVGGPGPTNNKDPLLFKVTSADPVNNWVFASALDTNSLPNVDTTIQHTYANAGLVTAQISDCCRISPCTSPNAHINNPDNNYRVTTVVNVGGVSPNTATPNSSPVSSLPPIVLCPQNGLCTFTIPVSDNEADPVTFRLSTNAEDGFNSGSTGRGQPGLGGTCPSGHAASVNSATGVYTWDTTGCRLASSATPVPPSGGCGNSLLNTLYSTQVMIEETGANTAKVALDFFIQLVSPCQGLNSPPAFDQQPPRPACGSTVSAGPGSLVQFPVLANDPNTGDLVELNVTGLPQGATMSPALPTTGTTSVTSTVSWTPALADLGQHVLTFTATDQCGSQVLCSVTIDVSQENCFNGVDDDGDGLIDCADPDCNGTCIDGNECTADSCDTNHNPPQCVHTPLTGTQCNDNNACTLNDTCQSGMCTPSSSVTCPLPDQCHTVGVCDPGTGVCSNPAKPDGSPCDDGNPNTQNDQCTGGVCAGVVSCDDGNLCNGTETPDGHGGCLQGTPLACDDGNACNGTETCNPQTGCVAGTPPVCDDGNVCNGTETCNPQTGCVAGTPLLCDDGNVCNGIETCNPQTGCVAGTALHCDDGNACTTDSCDPVLGCQNPPLPNCEPCSTNADCDNHNACDGVETCVSGKCQAGTAPNCNDSNVCTADRCNPASGCVNDPVPRNGFVCDDGDLCTSGDVCSGGVCSGTSAGDSDGDGYCDIREIQAGCDPNLAAEIPPQAPKYDGAGTGPGNVLLTYVAPTTHNVVVASDPSCATHGICGPLHFCTAGKIADHCKVDTDCDQSPGVCRVVVNWAAIPNLTLTRAQLNKQVITSLFTPVHPGCTLKVDVPLDPTKSKNVLKLKKATGTVAGRKRRDTDAFRYN